MREHLRVIDGFSFEHQQCGTVEGGCKTVITLDFRFVRRRLELSRRSERRPAPLLTHV